MGILSILRWCLSPSKGELMNLSTIRVACSKVMKRAGKAQILALLCLRANSAISSFQHSAERMRGCLLAVMLIPFPLPQSETP
jgi:hypothetical protein